MKKFLLIIPIMIFSMGLFAEEVQGYYITFEGDTVNATFIIRYFQETPNFASMTWLITYKDESGNKKVLVPTEVSEVFFIGEGNKVVRMISVINSINFKNSFTTNEKRFFAVPLIEGSLSLFSFHNYQLTLDGEFESYSSKILVNSNMEVIDFNRRKIIMNQSEVFSECPEILKLIKEKDESVESYWQIVNKYNSICCED